VVFRYVFPGEPPETDLSLGFFATGERASTDDVSRPAPLARAAGVPQRALVQRVARVVAHRLSRL
jgi:hypothetical protein